jgi:glycosyltransferase involved in cell wall biosynthesis
MSEAKKISILIATGIYPPDIGGPATMLAAMKEALAAAGLSVQIITYSDSGLGSEDGITRIDNRRLRPVARLWYFIHLCRLSFSADLIYATDTYSVGYFAYLLKKIFKKKYIIRFAGDGAWESSFNQGLTRDYIVDFWSKTYGAEIERLKRRGRLILGQADAVIAVSNFLSDLAAIIGTDRDNIRTIYNSIDFMAKDDRKASTDLRTAHAGAKLIMTVCRLTPWKGVDSLIRILPSVIEKTGDVRLVVLGTGSEMENLRRLARETRVEDKVMFLGKIDHNEVVAYLKQANLFILNTNYEGLSHTLLEAMKAGVPIITTRVGGNPEVINDGVDGLLVRYNYEQELADAATRILSDPALANKFVGNAAEKLKKFNWDNTVSSTITVIREVYEKNSAG